MSDRTKLKTVAAALLQAAEPELLAHILNKGLNGNKVITARAQDWTVHIGRRNTPKDGFVYDLEFAQDGTLVSDGNPIGPKILAALEKAVPIQAVAEVEISQGRVPAVKEMMLAAGMAEEALKDNEAKKRFGEIGVQASFRANAWAIHKICEFAAPEFLGARMGRFSNTGLDILKVGDEIVMLDAKGVRLASMGTKNTGVTAISLVAEHAMNQVFRAAVAGLDATLDLVSEASAHRKQEREAYKAGEIRREKVRQEQLTRDAQERLRHFNVKAGEAFVLNRSTYVYDHEDEVPEKTFMIAERDLGAREIVEILNDRHEGLARIIEVRSMTVNHTTEKRILDDLKHVGVSEDDAPGLE